VLKHEKVANPQFYFWVHCHLFLHIFGIFNSNPHLNGNPNSIFNGIFNPITIFNGIFSIPASPLSAQLPRILWTHVYSTHQAAVDHLPGVIAAGAPDRVVLVVVIIIIAVDCVRHHRIAQHIVVKVQHPLPLVLRKRAIDVELELVPRLHPPGAIGPVWGLPLAQVHDHAPEAAAPVVREPEALPCLDA